MKLLVTCSQCISKDARLFATKLEVRDDGLYELICPSGHKSATRIQQLAFEVLFEIGVHAVIDGYYREAVSSFTASLERFYEFALKALVRNSGGGIDVEKVWKPIQSSSERQLGAFSVVWSIVMGETPQLLPDSGPTSRSFRNAVVHKGKIPTRGEAVAFGQAVIEIMHPQIVKLRSEASETLRRIVVERLSAMETDAELVSTQFMNTAVSLSRVDEGPTDLETHIRQAEIFRTMADRLYGVDIGLMGGGVAQS